MDRNEFRDEILQELEDLDAELVRLFEWHCAVLALPIIGYKGNFNYWRVNCRQKYLLSIFSALDITIASAVAQIPISSASIVKDSILSLAPYIIGNGPAHDAVLVVYGASGNANVFGDKPPSLTLVVHTATLTVTAFRAANIESIKIDELLVSYVKNLKKNRKSRLNISIVDYGTIWGNFQEALLDEGCSYWGNLYLNVFENGFVMNQHALQMRFNVPEKVRDLGASAVGNYLDDLEEQSPLASMAQHSQGTGEL